MNSLLIIGGTGFFGKSILDAYKRGLLKKWKINSITIIARNANNLKISHPNLIDETIKFINDDITTCTQLPESDYVIHAAASTDANNYLKQGELERRNINLGTWNYCNLAQKFHKNSRIIYISSGAVYGKQPLNIEYITEEFCHKSLQEVSSSKYNYAKAKRESELFIQNLGHKGHKVSIARCFAFVGQWLPRNQHFAIGNFIEDGLLGRPITVKSEITTYRSYMYVDDLINWIMTICHHSTMTCPIYNVGSDEAVSVHNLAKIVAKKFSQKLVVKKINTDEVDRYIPSILKAKNDLNLDITINLMDAINITVEQIYKNEKKINS